MQALLTYLTTDSGAATLGVAVLWIVQWLKTWRGWGPGTDAARKQLAAAVVSLLVSLAAAAVAGPVTPIVILRAVETWATAALLHGTWPGVRSLESSTPATPKELPVR